MSKPVCEHCGQQYDRTAPTEGPRGVIAAVASQLFKWAEESVTGGWSTHQVKPMRDLADRLSMFLVTGRTPKDDAVANAPGMMVYEPGEYEHTCPACGNVIRFVVDRPFSLGVSR